MFSFANLARGRSSHSNYGYHPSYHRTEGVSPAKRDALVEMAIYKGTAVATAGLVGAMSAYKGLPEIKNFAGADIIVGVLGSVAEAVMIWKGSSGKATAVVGGVSTGAFCHWAAVQGTLWGATKAKAETNTKGWDYDQDYAHDVVTNGRELPSGDRNVQHQPPRTTTTNGTGWDMMGTA